VLLRVGKIVHQPKEKAEAEKPEGAWAPELAG